MKFLEQLTDFDLLWVIKISQHLTDSQKVGVPLPTKTEQQAFRILSSRYDVDYNCSYERCRDWLLENNCITRHQVDVIENRKSMVFDSIKDREKYFEAMAALAKNVKSDR